MTIDELLKLAQTACWLMDTEMARDKGTAERAAQYGMIAQGAAAVAQAMILNERGTLTIERIGEYVKATIGLVNVPAESDE